MKRSFYVIAVVLVLVAGGGAWYVHSKQPVRDGEMKLAHLNAPVSVRYDERGVPHIKADNEDDLYRALGYVHAQDRLFQMEILRRLARGELAEILGPKLVNNDKLFRSLRIREHADEYVARQDKNTPAWKALQAYLDGVNQYQDTHSSPIEFDVLGIEKRPFTAQDTLSIGGYLAYSFAAAFRTEPLMTFVRDRLGPDYLKVFDQPWQPDGALTQAAVLSDRDWQGLGDLALLSYQTLEKAGLPEFEGSNAWAVSGSRTQSGKPLLAGDPHIRFSVPAVWYEAQLSAPGFELYGHFQALNPFALLGHNMDFGWSLTMFQNDDLDLIAEKTNPDNPGQVWYHGAWADMTSRQEQIKVKGQEPVTFMLRQSPHGPIVNDALGNAAPDTPVAMWWSFLESENPILQGFYEANRADTLEKMRTAAQKIQSPGLNVVYANARGDIGWWAAAQLPVRPAGVNPTFILDGSSDQADKNDFYPFTANPQEENPARGYIVSANFQPVSPTGIEIPGYYNLAERGRQLDKQLSDPEVKWTLEKSKALQLGTTTDYAAQILKPLIPVLRRVISAPEEHDLIERLAAWKGDYPVDSVGATLFNQFLFNLSDQAFHDELGDGLFTTLLSTRMIDMALPRLAADANSVWWNNRNSNEPESRDNTVKVAWHATVSHLKSLYGVNPDEWTWGKAHTLTHEHPLGRQPPLDMLFNVGPFAAPGTHEVPNNLSAGIGNAPWPVSYGPSTRRLIDFAEPAHALGINPVGQSGVLFDKHYADQATRYINGEYVPERSSEKDVEGNSEAVLKLVPGR
ncbi:penicillin acylase family protein [Pseudomonas sp. NFR16]|uniref:penicillin acylase family protein n=1 Tax=Pseudomonas sp. NFR16 TaxID=1566248 RepID=UPI0008CFB359|nr:penicillin acylase family protein [Pseudomonas sp. NFR16]SEJ63601.1 penicillin amidase [Pseudomonas sp. NFR16]